MKLATPKGWHGFKTHCRCGARLRFSCEDIESGMPADGADFFCESGDPATGPHDWGVVLKEPAHAQPD